MSANRSPRVGFALGVCFALLAGCSTGTPSTRTSRTGANPAAAPEVAEPPEPPAPAATIEPQPAPEAPTVPEAPATPVEPPAPVAHRVLISGCSFGMVAIVGTDGEVEWSIQEPREVDDAWMLPGGTIVYAYKHGVKEVVPDLEKGTGARTVWERPTPAGGETHSCQPLDDGFFLVGESYDGVSYLIEVDRAGTERRKIVLKGLGGPHTTFRQVRKTPAGTYLVTQQRGGGKAIEVDADGTLVKEFGDGRFVAVRLPGGNTLLGCGDAHRVVEVDAQGSVVWKLGQNDVDGMKIGFAAGVVRLPNGNTLVCNWGGHGSSTGAAVIEVTPDKELVWSLPASIKARVASVQVLDPKRGGGSGSVAPLR